MEFNRESAIAAIQDPAVAPGDRQAALSWLLARKELKDSQPAIELALSLWETSATELSRPPSERLLAISEIVRIGSANPASIAASDRALASALKAPAPGFGADTDGDIRANVA